EHGALAALSLKIHAAIIDVAAVGLVDAFKLDDLEAAALGLGKIEIELAVLAGRRLDFVHAVNLLELALGLAGFGVLGAEPIDELHHAANFALLIFVGGQELRLGSFALQKVIVVVATIADEFALPNLDDAADELIEEFAV